MASTAFNRTESTTWSLHGKQAPLLPVRLSHFQRALEGLFPISQVPQRRSEASGPVPQSRGRGLSAGCRCSCRGTDLSSLSSSSAAETRWGHRSSWGCSTGKDPTLNCGRALPRSSVSLSDGIWNLWADFPWVLHCLCVVVFGTSVQI